MAVSHKDREVSSNLIHATVMELIPYISRNGGTVDTLDSKPSAEERESSSLSFGTKNKNK